MYIVMSMLPSFLVGIAGVAALPFLMRILKPFVFGYVLIYMALYSSIAIGVTVRFYLHYGTWEAAVGGFFGAMGATTLGLIAGVIVWALSSEREHQRRHRLSH